MDFDEVAAELYGTTPPEQFVDRRDAHALQARADGDIALANRIHGLRKPTVSAWLANLLAHHRADELTRFLDLGEGLRAALARSEGEQLRTLLTERRKLVAALVAEARTLAARPVPAQAGAEVEATLEAALSDPQAAHALRTGRLTKPLVAATQFTGPAPSSRPTGKLEAAVRAAQRELGHAQQRLSAADDAVAAAQLRSLEARRQLDELEKHTDAAKRRQAQARQDFDAAQRKLQEIRTRLGAD